MKLKNETYDVLKWIAITVIPALVVLINTVGTAVDYEYTGIITIVIGAVGLFLATILGTSTKNFNNDDEV